MFEKHYTVQELAELWNISPDTIRRWFRDDPGVMKIGKGTRRTSRGYVRGRYHLRIPESVAIRMHQQWQANDAKRR